jgi:hypothetical protein
MAVRKKGAAPAPTLCAAALATLLPLPALAARLNYEIGLGLLRSDNINLSQTDKQEDTIVAPRLRFDLDQHGPALDLDLAGDVQYLTYQENTYDDDWRGELRGDMEWRLLPERFSLFARETLSQQSVDTLQAFTPGNQQQINVFEAGPTFYARFGQTMQGQLDLRYTDSYAEETASFNSSRYSAAARLRREFSPVSRGLLNLEGSRVEYDQISTLYDYDRYDAYLTYQRELNAATLDIDAGYTRLAQRNLDQQTSGPLLRADLSWTPGARGTFKVGFSDQFADAAQDMLLNLDTATGTVIPVLPGDPSLGSVTPGIQIIPDVFREQRANVSWTYTGERLNLTLDPYVARLRYEQQDTFDQNLQGVQLVGSWQLRPLTTLSFLASWQRRDFDTVSRTDTDKLAGVGLAQRFSRRWSARLDLLRRERGSSIEGQDYTENSAIVSITYRR